MYVPAAYRAEDARAIARRHPFASLASVCPAGQLFLTQTPIVFETDATDEMRLIGHFAKANPHAAALYDGAPAIALFAGPHAYISPQWYVDKPTVATWDYISAQMSGAITPIDDADEQIAVLNRIIALSEAASGTNWTMEDAPAGKVDQLLPRIRSFRLTIDKIEGATKLNQTHPRSDRNRIADALDKRAHGDDAAIAELMREAGDT